MNDVETDSKPSQEPLNQLQSERPSSIFWLSYLFFMPTKFFKHFVIESTPWLTVVCAWTYGMVSVIDRISTRAQVSHESPPPDWRAYWILVAGLGIIGGALHFLIGGWWYRSRLKFCGAIDADKHLARRVYLFASQVIVIPVLLLTAYEAHAYSTPAQAEQSEGSYWHMLFFVFPFWSVWASYIGANIAFTLRRWPARIWFLILPGIFYAIIMGVLSFGLAYLATAAPADVAHPVTCEGYDFSFSYPKNWTTKQGDNSKDCYNLFVETPQDAAVIICLLYKSDNDLKEVLEHFIASYQENYSKLGSSKWQERENFQIWGNYSGLGKVMTMELKGGAYVLRVFVSKNGNDIFQIGEVFPENYKSKILPGFELIRSTFRLK